MISRLTPPTSATDPTPRMFSRRFLTTWSAKVVSACTLTLASGEVTASEKIGTLAGSKRETRESFTSSRSVGLIRASFSRTSSAARRPSMSRLNCTMTTELPS